MHSDPPVLVPTPVQTLGSGAKTGAAGEDARVPRGPRAPPRPRLQSPFAEMGGNSGKHEWLSRQPKWVGGGERSAHSSPGPQKKIHSMQRVEWRPASEPGSTKLGWLTVFGAWERVSSVDALQSDSRGQRAGLQTVVKDPCVCGSPGPSWP